ncbi:hypothetical protein [Streptomyces anulatus]|uniref:hypothetical protein n=1 Tax=Streptomyces anulatus TaxID=1892 RepID=UPI003417E9EB
MRIFVRRLGQPLLRPQLRPQLRAQGVYRLFIAVGHGPIVRNREEQGELAEQ